MKKAKSRLERINWKLLRKIGYWLVVAVLVVIAGVTAVSALDIPGSIKLYTVQSGSMAPAIPAGSLVISKPADDYYMGQVITFKAEKDKLIKNPKFTTTHRIYDVKETALGQIEKRLNQERKKRKLSTVEKAEMVLGKEVQKTEKGIKRFLGRLR